MKIKEILLELNVVNTKEIKSFIDQVYVSNMGLSNLPVAPPPIASWFNKQLYKWIINNEKLAVPVTKKYLMQYYTYGTKKPPAWLFPAVDRGEKVVMVVFDESNNHAKKIKKQISIIRAWLIWEHQNGNDKLMSKLSKLTMEEAIKRSKIWIKEEEQRKIDASKEKKDYKVMMKFDDGYTIVKLLSPDCKDLEGDIMQHCMSKNYHANGYVSIFSVRDPNNKAHVTIEVVGDHMKYVKGKQNRTPVKKYVPYVTAFAKKMKLDTYTNFKLKYGALRADGSNEMEAHHRRDRMGRAPNDANYGR